jgi:type II secretory pathway pseudopilin PulG
VKGVLRREDAGYAMAALLVAMSVMAIMLSTAMPVYQTIARREREAELVFRGEQYARAIALFQRKYANALPPDVDVLIDQRFLRKKYKDPITGGDFQFLGPTSPELAEALSTTPQQAQDALRGRGAGARGTTTSPFGRSQATGPAASQTGRSMQSGPGFTPSGRGTTFSPGRGAQTAAGQAANAQAGGGILAVASKSTQTSMRLYNGKDKYNQWVFMAVQSSLAAGAPPGSGGQTPGGRGGRAGGRGGIGPGRSGTAPPSPGGTRGRGGFSPMGTGR